MYINKIKCAKWKKPTTQSKLKNNKTNQSKNHKQIKPNLLIASWRIQRPLGGKEMKELEDKIKDIQLNLQIKSEKEIFFSLSISQILHGAYLY